MIASLFSCLAWLFVFLILDGIMIYFAILPLFKKYIPSYINTDMNYMAAIFFYIFYVLVILFLVVIPGNEMKTPLLDVFFRSLLFWFGAYMTYELTSMSVMKWWSWNMVILDTVWWTVLTWIIGVSMYVVYKYFI